MFFELKPHSTSLILGVTTSVSSNVAEAAMPNFAQTPQETIVTFQNEPPRPRVNVKTNRNLDNRASQPAGVSRYLPPPHMVESIFQIDCHLFDLL